MFLQTKSISPYSGYSYAGLPNYYGSSIVTNARPSLNIMYVPSSSIPAQRSTNMKVLMEWVRRTPEAIGIVRRIAQDIITKIDFEAIDLKRAGRPSSTYDEKRVNNAQVFSDNNFIKQELIAAVIDWLCTGDSFIWIGKISETQIKEFVEEKYNEFGLEFKEIDFKANEWIDEEGGINAIQTVASTSMEIIPDKERILWYIQRVGTDTKKFYLDQIIHAKFMQLDGKVYGFTPMESCSPVIRTLGLIKDYAGTFFENGGVPDYVFSFPKEMANSPNAKILDQKLQKYKGSANKHGNLIITGEVKVDQLGMGLDKDMEFRKLAIYYTGVLAFAFGMPADVLKTILGGDIKSSAGSADVEDSGYNRSIEEAQEYWETLLNSQLFYKYFKVRMKFKKRFMQDWIRMIQGRQQAMGVVSQMMSFNFPVSDEFYFDMLKIPDEYRIEGKIKKPEIEQGVPGEQLPNKKLLKGPATEAYSEEKKKTAGKTERQQRGN